MTSKGRGLIFKGNDNSFVNNHSLNDFKDFTLKSTSNCKLAFSIPVETCRKSIFGKMSGTAATIKITDFALFDNCDKSKRLNSWNKSPKILNSAILNDKAGKEEVAKKRWKKNDSSDIKNSTLSLHISAYENSSEAVVAFDKFGGKNNLEKKALLKKTKQIFSASTFVIQNPFEFPRQQNYEVPEPEILRFRASQHLHDPGALSPNSLMLYEKSRCCICFENYSRNYRAPVCAPCGHSFCAVCISKLIYGNLVCCCICRKVTFFGPRELGRNIQLLDILESLELLDHDDEKPAQAASSSTLPESVIEAVDDRDLVHFLTFCFNFVKKFYEDKEGGLLANLAMANPNGHLEIAQHANEMFNARGRLNESLDRALERFNECLQTMNSHVTDQVPILAPYGGVDEYVPVMEDNYNDPFGLESAAIHAFIALNVNHNIDFSNNFDGVETSAQSPVDDFNFANDFFDVNDYNAVNDDFIFNPVEEEEEFEDPPFQPGVWSPLSRLFALSRSQSNNR